MRFEVEAPGDVTFSTLPIVEPTLQRISPEANGRGGSLRIELGSWVHLGRDTVIEVAPGLDSVLRLGDGTRCFGNVRFLCFGGSIHLGARTRVREAVSIKSSGRLVCGEDVILQSFCMLHCSEELVLADRVGLAERVSIVDSDHLVDGTDTFHQLQPVASDPVHIEPNVWLGAGSIVLRGARLGANGVVAAGSVVRGGTYPPGWLVAGAPATAKRPLPGAAATDVSPTSGC